MKAPLPVHDDGPDELAVAIDQIDSEFACIVVATGQRDAEWLSKLRSEVAWRVGAEPVVVNAGRLGLIAFEMERFEATIEATRAWR